MLKILLNLPRQNHLKLSIPRGSLSAIAENLLIFLIELYVLWFAIIIKFKIKNFKIAIYNQCNLSDTNVSIHIGIVLFSLWIYFVFFDLEY